MSVEYKYQAIILSKIDIAETDRIYTAYTEEAGKVRLLAKGVRKPNAKLAGNLEPLTYSEVFVAKSRGRGNVTGAISAENFSRLKENISAIRLVFYAFSIFDRLVTEEEKEEKVFWLLLEYLRAMDKVSVEEENPKADILTFGFIFKLLENLGYAYQMKKCVLCGGKLEPLKNYFSAERGGAICGACAERERRKMRISDETIKFIRIFSENKIENLGKIKAEKKSLDNLKIILDEAVRWIIG